MNDPYKLDLHTHSSISYDGGISEQEFREFLRENPSRFLAITDHNEISLAVKLHEEFGERVIVGEEIKTKQGEIIGLFLIDRIQPNLNAAETVAEIRKQNGLVYIPHALEFRRAGVGPETLESLASSIDIIEVYNARSFEPWARKKVSQFAVKNNLAQAASSDAHSRAGLGTAFSLLSGVPNRDNLVALVKGATLQSQRAPLWSLLAPARNKLRKRFRR